MNNTVHIVMEDEVGEMATIRRTFDNAAAAQKYVNDPEQLGHLFVVEVTVESEYNQ